MDNIQRKQLCDDYYRWLVDLIDGEDYDILLRYLQDQSFHYILPMDENRAMDGIDLRDRFIYETNYPAYESPSDDCTMLEFLIGLAFRINDVQVEIGESNQTSLWFWRLVYNLELDIYTNENFYEYGGFPEIDMIIERLINRTYDEDGLGGLFPLEYPPENQRDVEIWYQMSMYLNEKY